MTSEERIVSLHRRMNALQERQETLEERKTAALGAGCGVLAVCLLALIISEGRPVSGGTAGLYSGATMLFENAGGYVAIAVAAFMIGVVITVWLLKRRFRTGNRDSRNQNRTEE